MGENTSADTELADASMDDTMSVPGCVLQHCSCCTAIMQIKSDGKVSKESQ